MKVTVLCMLLLLMCEGCSVPKEPKTVMSVSEETTTSFLPPKPKPHTRTEAAVRATLPVIGVLALAGMVAGGVMMFFGSDKRGGLTVLLFCSVVLGASLFVDAWLETFRWVIGVVVLGGLVWEIVTHFAVLKEDVMTGVRGVSMSGQ